MIQAQPPTDLLYFPHYAHYGRALCTEPHSGKWTAVRALSLEYLAPSDYLALLLDFDRIEKQTFPL